MIYLINQLIFYGWLVDNATIFWLWVTVQLSTNCKDVDAWDQTQTDSVELGMDQCTEFYMYSAYAYPNNTLRAY